MIDPSLCFSLSFSRLTYKTDNVAAAEQPVPLVGTAVVVENEVLKRETSSLSVERRAESTLR